MDQASHRAAEVPALEQVLFSIGAYVRAEVRREVASVTLAESRFRDAALITLEGDCAETHRRLLSALGRLILVQKV